MLYIFVSNFTWTKTLINDFTNISSSLLETGDAIGLPPFCVQYSVSGAK
jgi:hypothetical protein